MAATPASTRLRARVAAVDAALDAGDGLTGFGDQTLQLYNAAFDKSTEVEQLKNELELTATSRSRARSMMASARRLEDASISGPPTIVPHPPSERRAEVALVRRRDVAAAVGQDRRQLDETETTPRYEARLRMAADVSIRAEVPSRSDTASRPITYGAGTGTASPRMPLRGACGGFIEQSGHPSTVAHAPVPQRTIAPQPSPRSVPWGSTAVSATLCRPGPQISLTSSCSDSASGSSSLHRFDAAATSASPWCSSPSISMASCTTSGSLSLAPPLLGQLSCNCVLG